MNPSQDTHTALTWTVIGGGNGGQALAGHLALMGQTARLYDIFPATIEAIDSQRGIRVEGVVEGFGPLELATTDIETAIAGANILVVVAPATAHAAIAADCAPHLADGQIIIIHPGATGGSLEFRQVLLEKACRARVTLAETNSLLYACRSPEPGRATIFGIKKDLLLAALPAAETAEVLRSLNPLFPQIRAAKNVLQTGLGNPNAMMHPAPTILNTSMIESGREWRYYLDGITPSIGAFVEAVDRERLAVGQAYGVELTPILKWYREAYNAKGDTLTEAVRANPAYAEVQGQKTLQTRYLLEDIPTGLVPMAALGKAAGVDVSKIELVISMGEHLLGEDFQAQGRSLKRLGLDGLSVTKICALIEGNHQA